VRFIVCPQCVSTNAIWKHAPTRSVAAGSTRLRSGADQSLLHLEIGPDRLVGRCGPDILRTHELLVLGQEFRVGEQ